MSERHPGVGHLLSLFHAEPPGLIQSYRQFMRVTLNPRSASSDPSRNYRDIATLAWTLFVGFFLLGRI